MSPARIAINDLLDRAIAALRAQRAPLAQTLAAEIAALPGDRRAHPPTRAPALVHLDAALRLGSPATQPLLDAIARARPALAWRQMERDAIGEALRAALAYVEIVGPEGVAPATRLRAGLFLQAPRTDYPDHAHEAEEFYLVLAGTARWRKGRGRLRPLPPGATVHHRPAEPHAMVTGDQPLLALWVWRGAIDGRYWLL